MIVEKEGKPERGSARYTGDLSKWWKTPSARAAVKRANKVKRERLRRLRKLVAEKKGNNGK